MREVDFSDSFFLSFSPFLFEEFQRSLLFKVSLPKSLHDPIRGQLSPQLSNQPALCLGNQSNPWIVYFQLWQPTRLVSLSGHSADPIRGQFCTLLCQLIPFVVSFALCWFQLILFVVSFASCVDCSLSTDQPPSLLYRPTRPALLLARLYSRC
jgi:hypothetical protein